MRILFPTTEFPPLSGGVATLAYEQATGLARLGETVHVETLDFGPGPPVEFAANLTVNAENIRSGAIRRLVPLFRNLAKASRAFRPDFIYSPTYRGFGLPVSLLSRLTKCPFGLYMHGTEIRTELSMAVRRSILRQSLNMASFVLTNSNGTRSLLCREFPQLRPPVLALPPGIDFDKFQGNELARQAASLRAGWLKQAGVRGDAVVLLSLCRLSYQKGIDYVLRAMARMPAVGANAPLVYVSAGTGPHLENFQRLAAELGIGARVLFPGVVPYAETPVVMSAADIYVQPSQPYGVIVESFGISFVEAQAAGVPCIGTSFGGIPEAVDTDRSGLLVPVEDLESLVSALESLVSDPGLRKTMGEHGRAFARKHSRTRHMEQLRTLISEHARK